MSEASLTKKCDKFFKQIKKERPADFYFQKISDRFTSGIPDYYLLFSGCSIWIELKDEGEKPGAIQNWTLRELSRAGAVTLWTDDFSQVQELIEAVISQPPRLLS